MKTALRLLLPAALFAFHAFGSNNFELSRNGDRYDLTARHASLSDILLKIDELEEADIRLYGQQNRTVHVVYKNQTLDQLLYRLGVSYMLVYENNKLGDALLLESDAGTLDPVIRVRLQKLIKDLQSDDIVFNAHSALYELYEVGCDAVPMLEQALYGHDYQGVQLAASALRGICPDYIPTDKLLEVTLELLRREPYDAGQYWSLFTPSEAFWYISEQTNIYPRVRNRLFENLGSSDRQERLLSALLLAERGEYQAAAQLVRILAPHLADNDMKSDGAAAAHALYQLGPSVLAYLEPYRTSADVQQAEMAALIWRAIDEGEVPSFNPAMYVGYTRNPLLEKPWVNATYWYEEKFPDENGVYPSLDEHRWTAEDYYGTGYEETNDAPAESPFLYVSKEGDTLSLLAQRFSVDEAAIRSVNPEVDWETLEPGTYLNIPWL